MTKKALISTAELTRLAAVAKKANVTVEMEIEGIVIRVKPYEAPDEKEPANKLPDDFAL